MRCLCAPPFSVPLRFGDDSYFPHLVAARAAGIEPVIVRLPGIGLDIDHPADLRKFVAAPAQDADPYPGAAGEF